MRLASQAPCVLLISPGIIKWTDMDFGLPHLVSMGGYLLREVGEARVRVELLDLNYEGTDHQTLARHAEAAGFEVVRISSSLSGATQWALSGLAWWAAFQGRPFRSTHEPLYPPLILACLPIAALEALFSHTCHMDFVLRRPR